CNASNRRVGQTTGWRFNPSGNVIRPGNFDVVDFSEIVILGGKPKDRDRFDAGGCCLTCKFDRRQGFVDRKYWPSKQADLLSRHDGVCTGPQTSEISQSRIWRAPVAILALKYIGDLLVPLPVVRNLRSFVLKPIRKSWRAAVELADCGRLIQEVGKEAGGMRDFRKRQTLHLHRRNPRVRWRSPLMVDKDFHCTEDTR